jgi:hypothetical protein
MAVSTLFMLFGPALGLFIRQGVARQREYLADAEAVLLTRDPEGLALALTRIGAWRARAGSRSGPRPRICASWTPCRPTVHGGSGCSLVTHRSRTVSSSWPEWAPGSTNRPCRPRQRKARRPGVSPSPVRGRFRPHASRRGNRGYTSAGDTGTSGRLLLAILTLRHLAGRSAPSPHRCTKSRTDGQRFSANSPKVRRSRSAERRATFSRSQPQIVWSGTSVSWLAIMSSRLGRTAQTVVSTVTDVKLMCRARDC